MNETSIASVTSEIHADDHLFGFLNGRFGEEQARKIYATGGRSDAAQIEATMRRFQKGQHVKVLEFASGYGRVTRFLKDMLPADSLYASDIHPQACDFVTTTVGVPTLPSSSKPEDLDIGRDYDFIFVISLFSHLPDSSFARWIDALVDILAPNGHLMFTTHGDMSTRNYKGTDLSRYENGDGWIYIRNSDQPDIDDSDYGTMLVQPNYVTRAIATTPRAILRSFTSAAWFGHQDEWVIQRA